MTYITGHWSGGPYQPTWLDKKDYQCGIVRDPKTGYAHGQKWHNYTDVTEHTWNRNTNNIGVSIIGMVAPSSISNFGPCPITQAQIDEFCLCVAEICVLKGLDPMKAFKTHAEWAVIDGYGVLSYDPETRWDLAILAPLKKAWPTRAAAEAQVKATGDLLRKKIVVLKKGIIKPRDFHYKAI